MSTEKRNENYNVKQNKYSKSKKSNPKQFAKGSYNAQNRSGNDTNQKGKRSYKKKPYVKNGSQKRFVSRQ